MTKVIKKGAFTINDLENGDVFSEVSYYKFEGENGKGEFMFSNVQRDDVEPFPIGKDYVEAFLNSADHFSKDGQVTVGKLDKIWTQGQIDKGVAKGDIAPGDYKAGDIKQQGIRTIWDNIGNQCFTVVFQKADKKKTKKQINIELADQRKAVLDAVAFAKKSKKSMTKAIEQQLEIIQNNPVTDITPGDLRPLRGYKLEHTSLTGKYMCFDINIGEPRPVNINTIHTLIVNGKCYTVK